MFNVAKFFNFLRSVHRFGLVERGIKGNDNNRMENDLEHVGQLGLVCWYLIRVMNLNLNESKIFKLVLGHDLVEIYSGDTDPYLSEKEYLDSKDEREKKAQRKLKKEISEFGELHEIIKDYKHKKSAEAKFVYAVDKLLPAINIFTIPLDYYTVNKITEERWRGHNLPKIAVSEDVAGITEQIVAYMKQQNPKFYYNK